MDLFCQFFRSTVGKKILMAVSGLIMIGFVLGHMAGNLKVFAGFDPAIGMYTIDHYAIFLREILAGIMGHGNFLWVVRAVLLLAVMVHFVSAYQLALLNRRAKPPASSPPDYRSSNAASRTMVYGGTVLLIFIVFHILHLTTGTLHFRGFQEGKVYSNLTSGLAPWYLALFYVIAVGALAMHLYHGVWSMFQTLGVTSPTWNAGLRGVAKLVAVVLFVGFSVVPLAVVTGILPSAGHAASTGAVVQTR